MTKARRPRDGCSEPPGRRLLRLPARPGSPADVTRAVDSVAEHFGEGSPHREDAARPGYHGPQHYGRWHSRARDVMTTSVITADRLTPYKEIAERLAQHQGQRAARADRAATSQASFRRAT